MIIKHNYLLYCQANLAIQQGKHDTANRNLKIAEMLLKAKDEDLRQVQYEFDEVMGERQVYNNNCILKLHEYYFTN
jgi:hypothetical protein